MGAGIVCGVIAFLVVGAVVSQLVVHDSSSGSAFLSGAIAAAWCIWPAMKSHQVERYNLLKPPPKRYNMEWKIAYAKVREILERATYKMNSKWNVRTSDTQSKHIYATLNFTDEDARFEAPGGKVENIRRTTKVVRRLVELDVQFNDQDSATIVQLDFKADAEGDNFMYACDFVVEDIKRAIDRELGAGTEVAAPAQFVLGAPPWWLLGLSAFGIMNLWEAVQKAVFGQ